MLSWPGLPYIKAESSAWATFTFTKFVTQTGFGPTQFLQKMSMFLNQLYSTIKILKKIYCIHIRVKIMRKYSIFRNMRSQDMEYGITILLIIYTIGSYPAVHVPLGYMADHLGIR